MSRLSKIFRDQKEHPLERAIWWVEWVLRNPDNMILQSNAVHLNWFVKYSLDVIAPIVLLTAALLVAVCKVMKKILDTMPGKTKSKRE